MAIPSKFPSEPPASDEARTRDPHLGKVAVSRLKRNAAGVTILAFYFFCMAVFAVAAKPHRPTQTYAQTVNVTLDAVMFIHEQHKGKLTWAQLNQEVCRYMRVRRTEPWQRR